MQIFAAAARAAIHQNGLDQAVPIIAKMHHCSEDTARSIARSVIGRQDDTISPLTDADPDERKTYHRNIHYRMLAGR